MNLPKTPKLIEYTAISILFTLPTVWLTLFTICFNDWWPSVCANPLQSYTITGVLVVILTLWPIGWTYRERALRRARRGMWAGSGSVQLSQVFDRVVEFVVGAVDGDEAPGTITGEERFAVRGWWQWVEVDGGRKVWVDRRRFWEWLVQVENLHHALPAGESAIGQRRWEPILGRDLWMAYCDILETIGAAECPTGDPRSRRYVPGAPWGRVEMYERMRHSEVR